MTGPVPSILARHARTLPVILFAAWLGACQPGGNETPSATADDADARAGRVLLGSRDCLSCHAVQGQGGDMAPELGSELAARGESWILGYLTSGRNLDVYPGNGHRMFADLSPQQAQQLARYLASLTVSAQYQGPPGAPGR